MLKTTWTPHWATFVFLLTVVCLTELWTPDNVLKKLLKPEQSGAAATGSSTDVGPTSGTTKQAGIRQAKEQMNKMRSKAVNTLHVYAKWINDPVNKSYARLMFYLQQPEALDSGHMLVHMRNEKKQAAARSFLKTVASTLEAVQANGTLAAKQMLKGQHSSLGNWALDRLAKVEFQTTPAEVFHMVLSSSEEVSEMLSWRIGTQHDLLKGYKRRQVDRMSKAERTEREEKIESTLEKICGCRAWTFELEVSELEFLFVFDNSSVLVHPLKMMLRANAACFLESFHTSTGLANLSEEILKRLCKALRTALLLNKNPGLEAASVKAAVMTRDGNLQIMKLMKSSTKKKTEVQVSEAMQKCFEDVVQNLPPNLKTARAKAQAKASPGQAGLQEEAASRAAAPSGTSSAAVAKLDDRWRASCGPGSTAAALVLERVALRRKHAGTGRQE
ncbi:unnamed protein product [Symbiodinium sp. CCMP2592]|nr:unnamed protein product [Symbiodinium sp. CCMP2592]